MTDNKLDPSNCLNTPSLASEAMTVMAKVELDLNTDLDTRHIREAQTRGNLCFVCGKRHVKANDNYLSECDPNHPPNYILCEDAHNLYAWAL